MRTPTLGVRIQLALGWKTGLPIDFDIENFAWKTCKGEEGSIILLNFFSAQVFLMSVGEDWCGWFYTPVCDYKFHARLIYTPHLQHLQSESHLEFSRTSAIKLFCGNSQRVKAVGYFLRICSITCYSSKKV